MSIIIYRSELIKAVQYFIHLNLSIALLSLYLVFCFGIDSSIIDTTNSKVNEIIIIVSLTIYCAHELIIIII